MSSMLYVVESICICTREYTVCVVLSVCIGYTKGDALSTNTTNTTARAVCVGVLAMMSMSCRRPRARACSNKGSIYMYTLHDGKHAICM